MDNNDDKYFEAYDALWKSGMGEAPFQVLTHIELGDTYSKDGCSVKFYWENLVTGEKTVKTEKLPLAQKRVVTTPPKWRKVIGPYFCNGIEDVVKQYHKDYKKSA